MNSACRSIALAAALSALSSGAFSALVSIDLDFNADGDALIGPPVQAPAKLENVPGKLSLTNAWVYKLGMFDTGDVVSAEIDDGKLPWTCGTSSCNDTGYISNRPRGGPSAPLTLALDRSILAQGQYIKALSFSFWHSALQNQASITFFDALGGREDWGNISAGDQQWSRPVAFELKNLTEATRVEFVFGAPLGLDDLKITLTAATGGGGGTVPEPASYALVGMALLAVGASTRRRKA